MPIVDTLPLQPQRLAVLSMDVEDWYQLGYFPGTSSDRSYSMLDGFDRFLEFLQAECIQGSLFVVHELLAQVRVRLVDAIRVGHDVGSHGSGHRRPMTISPAEFYDNLRRSRSGLADVLGIAPEGYRAPSFSIDRERLDLIRETGFAYDSSRIQFGMHPDYGTLDLSGFSRVRPGVYRSGGFFEFELSTCPFLGRTVPIAGGAYLRWLPWWVMQCLLRRHAATDGFYVLYIHPFELSSRAMPPVPSGTSWLTKRRFSHGRRQMPVRFLSLIQLLRDEGFSFISFARLRAQLLESMAINSNRQS